MTSINLPKFIQEHYKGGVTARDVVREGLTNAIHAGGTDIHVELNFTPKQQDLVEDDKTFLQRIAITDDGEGFTSKNLGYFDEICTSHKDSIGGKGVGRLSYLKFGNEVSVHSQLSNQLVQFPYTPTFSLDDVLLINREGSPKTIVTIADPKERIYTQVPNLINGVCDDLRLMLFLKKRAGKSVRIVFAHNSGQQFETPFVFSSDDIEPLIERPGDIGGIAFDFYLFSEPSPRRGISAMLCANEVCVEEISISKRFDPCRYVVSVTSPYLDAHANLERKKIALPEVEEGSDLLSPLSRTALVKGIHGAAVTLVNEVAQKEVVEFKEKNVEKLKNYYPFIDITSLEGSAAFLDAEEIIRNYRAQQARAEDRIIETLERGQDVSWDDVSHLASEDLARYIVHRALVLDSLAKLPEGVREEAIHSAILPKNDDGSDLRTNNVWIVDDKFLSYSSVFSDQTLRRIVSTLNQETESAQGRKPDVAAFFMTDDHDQPNKLVIIEFKKPGENVFANSKALTQCRVYANELVEKVPSVREVFSFCIVDVDDEFYRDLKQTGFKDVFSLTDRVVYNDFKVGLDDDVPLHLYVMPAASLIKDAKARNRIFEEVLQMKPARD